MAARERHRAEVIGAFGGPVDFHAGDADDGCSPTTAHEDLDLVRRTLQGFNEGGAGFLRIYRPGPTAAFSPRDMTLNRYGAAAEAMCGLGFAPVERRAGGQLAVYDGASLVIDLVAPHRDPRNGVVERFRLFSGAIANVLDAFGVDARVGEIDGEFCPGRFSVNAQGRIKLAGVAQRIGRCGYHLGAVISVTSSSAARDAIEDAYRILDLSFDPKTFGALADFAPGMSSAILCQRLRGTFAENLIAVPERQLPAKRLHPISNGDRR